MVAAQPPGRALVVDTTEGKTMKLLGKGTLVLAVVVAVIAPALAAGAQSSDDIEYWNAAWENEASCFKDSHGSTTDDGLAVVLSEYDPSWGGTRWEGLAVYAGDEHIAYQSPDAGVEYAAPDGAAVTSWVACKGTAAQETTTTTAAPEETTTTTAAPEETTTTTAAPEETTTTTSTTAAPAGGVAAGAGGTAGSGPSALLVLGGIAALVVVAGAAYAGRQRSES
jgi:hypothetical protein